MNRVEKWLDPEAKSDFWIQLSSAISKEQALLKRVVNEVKYDIDPETMSASKIVEDSKFFNVPYSPSIMDNKNMFPTNHLIDKAIDFESDIFDPKQVIKEFKEAYEITTNYTKLRTTFGQFPLEESPTNITFGMCVYSDEPIEIQLGLEVRANDKVTIVSQTYSIDDNWTKIVFTSGDLVNIDYLITPFVDTSNTLYFSKVFLYKNEDATEYIPNNFWAREEAKATSFKNKERNTPVYYSALFRSIYETGQYGRYIVETYQSQPTLAKDFGDLHDEIISEVDLEQVTWGRKSSWDFSTEASFTATNKLDTGKYLDDGSLVLDDIFTKQMSNHLALEYEILECKLTKDIPKTVPFDYFLYLQQMSTPSRAVTTQLHKGCQFNQAFDIDANAYGFNSKLRVNRFNNIFVAEDIASITIGSLPGVVSQETFDSEYASLTEYATPLTPFKIDQPLAIIPLTPLNIKMFNGWLDVNYEYIGGYRNALSPIVTGEPTTYTHDLADAFNSRVKPNSIKASFQTLGVVHTIKENTSLEDNGIGTLVRVSPTEVELTLNNIRRGAVNQKVNSISSREEITLPEVYMDDYIAESIKVSYYINGAQFFATEQPDHSLVDDGDGWLSAESEVVYVGGIPFSVIIDVGALNLTIYTDVEATFTYNSTQGIDETTQIVYEYFDSVPRDITQVSLNAVDGSVLASCNFNPIELRTWDFHIAFGFALKG